ncbi:hypothetical protein EYW98_20020 [Escherichia coli]|nr:hypothetical protein [Escherichia coli]EGO8378108.1 hypothetical protein [Escherichia coli]
MAQTWYARFAYDKEKNARYNERLWGGGFGQSRWDENFHLGLGFTAGVTARDNWNYIPLPVLLPLASVGDGPETFHMTYILGTSNNGNVYFAWMHFQF